MRIPIIILGLLILVGSIAGAVMFVAFPNYLFAEAEEVQSQSKTAAGAPPVEAENAKKIFTDQRAIGDWSYGCRMMGTEKRCSIRQWVKDTKSGATIFTWAIEQNGKGGLAGAWQSPNGVLLRHGLVLSIGADKPVVLPFESCGRIGCVTQANMASGFVDKLVAAKQIQTTVLAVSGRPLTVTISTRGLSEGLAALK